MTQEFNYLFLHQRLSTRSKRAIERVYGKFGRRYYYTPRQDLTKRLATELEWEPDTVKAQLLREREILVKEYFKLVK